MLVAVIFLIAAGLMMFGCGSRTAPPPPAEQPPPVDTTTPPPPPPTTPDEPPPPPRATDLMPIYFDFDKANLKSEAKATLNANAELLKAESGGKIIIEGHCDERGTNEYNLALGERRAMAAYEYLKTLGISSDRMSTISFGEERPAATGNDESAWSRNRRAEFVRSGN